MEPRIYMSTDEGAPVLGATAGSLIGVLDACLVNGYGELPGAGWEKFVIATNSAAYRAPAGLRHYLSVIDTTTTTATVNGYKTLVDTDFGSAFSSSTVYWGKCVSGVAAGRQWIVAADDKRVLVFVVPSAGINTGFRAVGGFGELAARRVNDLNASYLIGGSVASDVVAAEDANLTLVSGLIVGNAQQTAYMPGGYGNNSAPGKYAGSLNAPPITSLVLSADYTDLPLDYVWSSRILMRDRLSAGAVDSVPSASETLAALTSTPRGYIPGLLVPMMEMLSSQFPFWTSLGNGQYVIPYSSRRCYVLDTSDWEYS